MNTVCDRCGAINKVRVLPLIKMAMAYRIWQRGMLRVFAARKAERQAVKASRE